MNRMGIHVVVLMLILLIVSGNTPIPPDSIAAGRIAFVSNQDGDNEIYTMNADGTDITQLTHNDLEDRDPNWSPDGSQIVYVSDTAALNLDRELLIMNADGSEPRSLTAFSGDAFDPDWSPDGQQIAFILFRSEAASQSPNIFTITPDGSDLTQITFGTGEEHDNCFQPSWSPDGQHLAYLMGEVGGSVISSMDSFGLYTIDLSTLTPATLPAGPSFNNVDWSPDGQTIIFEGVSLIEEIQAVNADGTNYRILSNNPQSSNNPAWSPSGKKIVFEMSGQDIGIMDADGENIVNLTNTPDVWEREPQWQPVLADQRGK